LRPELANSLNNLSNRLSDLGWREEALDAIQDAVDIYRGLAESLPEAFRPNLATSLGARGNALKGLGRMDEARASYAEGLEIVTPTADRYPDGPPGQIRDLLRNDLKLLDDDEAE
jgi:tetratricopeptide (TPR) repeat protein